MSEASISKRSPLSQKTYFLKFLFLLGAIGWGIMLIFILIHKLVIENIPEIPLQVATTLFTGKFVFGDFLETMAFCFMENPYLDVPCGRTIYFPISYLIIYPFALLGKDAAMAYLANPELLATPERLPGLLPAYLLYAFVCIALILLVSAYFSHLKGWDLFYLMGGILLHGSIAFALGRGNTIFVTFLGILLFFGLYHHKKWWLRELGYVCFALAISIKVYPVLLAMVFFRERRYFPLLRTAIYTLVFLFAPFFFVPGGLSNVGRLLQNMSAFSVDSDRFLVFTNISWAGLLGKVQFVLDFLPYLASPEALMGHVLEMIQQNAFLFTIGKSTLVISQVLGLACCVLTLVFSFFQPKKGSAFPYMTLLIMNFFAFPSVHFCYVHLLFVLLTIVYLHEMENMNLQQKVIYGMCLLFAAFPFQYFYQIPLLSSFAQGILLVFSIIDLVHLYLRKTPACKETVSSPETLTEGSV